MKYVARLKWTVSYGEEGIRGTYTGVKYFVKHIELDCPLVPNTDFQFQVDGHQIILTRCEENPIITSQQLFTTVTVFRFWDRDFYPTEEGKLICAKLIKDGWKEVPDFNDWLKL